jgi:hypothetical protein
MLTDTLKRLISGKPVPTPQDIDGMRQIAAILANDPAVRVVLDQQDERRTVERQAHRDGIDAAEAAYPVKRSDCYRRAAEAAKHTALLREQIREAEEAERCIGIELSRAAIDRDLVIRHHTNALHETADPAVGGFLAWLLTFELDKLHGLRRNPDTEIIETGDANTGRKRQKVNVNDFPQWRQAIAEARAAAEELRLAPEQRGAAARVAELKAAIPARAEQIAAQRHARQLKNQA